MDCHQTTRCPANTSSGETGMAQRNTAIPLSSQENEMLTWPGREEAVSPSKPAEKIKEAYQSAYVVAEHSLRVTQRKLSDTTGSIIRSVRRFADERPLRLVAIVAGVAFATGVALRIWRSSSYE